MPGNPTRWSPATWVEWAFGVLRGIGVPQPNQTQVMYLISWALREGTISAYNPLATTYTGFGAYHQPGYYISWYPTMGDGINAVVATLRNGRYNGIIRMFQRQTWSAMPASEFLTWSGHGYSTIAGNLNEADAVVRQGWPAAGSFPPSPAPGTLPPPVGGGHPPRPTAPHKPVASVTSAWNDLMKTLAHDWLRSTQIITTIARRYDSIR